MSHPVIDRRGFLKGSVKMAAAAGLAAASGYSSAQVTKAANAVSSGLRPIRLGGPVFNAGEDPEAIALAHRTLGYRAAYCPGVTLDNDTRIGDISKAFAKHDVVIAEVGRWCNLMDADPEKRKANLKAVTDGLALADAVGALCCVDIAGSFNPDVWYGPHPDNLTRKFFDAAVENARKIIDAVKPKRAKFCYEMMGWAIPDSPDSYAELIKAVDRDAFAVHLDLCNLVNSPARFYRNAALVSECFDKLGPWIVSCHAKDLAWDVEMNVHFREVPVGQGKMDYTAYLRSLAGLDHEAPLMIEHCANEQEYDKARKAILDVGAKTGVRFG
jgi:sugar phosphate isomerase/epimerase